MITTKDIVTAVNKTMKAAFPEISVKSTDFRKNVTAGSLYTEYPRPAFDGPADFRHESGTIRIYYFPKNEDYREELADMQAKLSEVFFGILRINEDFAIPINELAFEESDGVLIAAFDYETYQLTEETGEDMESLELGFSETE